MRLTNMIDQNRFNPLVDRRLLLVRREVTDDFIMGELRLFENDKRIFNCYTIERSWKDNRPYVSAIPPAVGETMEYPVEVLQKSQAFNYPHLWIRNVPGRTVIKIHRANRAPELHGCIAPGLDYNYGEVLRSKDALDKLMSHMKPYYKFPIRIEYL